MVVSSPASADAASTSFAKYKTKGCPKEAPNWRIGYRFFFASASGSTLPRDATTKAAERAARKFVDQVGSFSRCGVRAEITLFDEGAAVWSSCTVQCPFKDLFPPDTNEFRVNRKLDAVLNRYPQQHPDEAPGQMASVSINDDGVVDGWAARFPVDKAFRDTEEGEPWRNLLLHEWLHMVVGHVSRRELAAAERREPDPRRL